MGRVGVGVGRTTGETEWFAERWDEGSVGIMRRLGWKERTRGEWRRTKGLSDRHGENVPYLVVSCRGAGSR